MKIVAVPSGARRRRSRRRTTARWALNPGCPRDPGRTEMPAAVARPVQLVPPARVDLVDEVLVGVGRRDRSITLNWPPIHLVHQLAYRVKRVHLGEVRMPGPNGVVVDVVRYRDKLGYDRRCYRLTRHGVRGRVQDCYGELELTDAASSPSDKDGQDAGWRTWP